MQGDESVIRAISKVCGSEMKTPARIPLRRTGVSTRKRLRPVNMYKSIMQAEQRRNHIHRSSSEMNIHQFRREAMKTFFQCSSRRAKYESTQTLSKDGSTSALFGSTETDITDEPRHSWKSSVSSFWEILAVQCSPSYCNSIKVRCQSFGLPPTKLEDGSEVMPDAETSSSTSSQSPPRRSSMPTSSGSSRAALHRQVNRRRSEATLGLNTPLAIGFVDRVSAKRSEGLIELWRATEALDSKVDQWRGNRGDVTSKTNNITALSDGGGRAALSSTNAQKDVVTLKKQLAASVIRNRLSTSRQLPLSPERNRMGPPTVADLDAGRAAPLPSIAQNTNTSFASSKDASITVSAKPVSVKNTLGENATNCSVIKDGGEKRQRLPEKTPRRGSILSRERVLADIKEENEVYHGARAAESFIPLARKRPSAMRSVSAAVLFLS